MTARYALPDIRIGLALDQIYTLWAVLPEGTTNLFRNPGTELNTTFWTAQAGATISRSAERSFRGAYSLKTVCDAAQVNSGAVQATATGLGGASQAYTVQTRLYLTNGRVQVWLRFNYTDATGENVGIQNVIRTGKWLRVSASGVSSGSKTLDSVAIHIRTPSALACTFYADDVQCERKGYPTTYADGDMLGFIKGEAAYLWTGAAHGSTSQRSTSTRSGGREVNLAQYGLTLLGLLGMGFAEPVNIATPLALRGGSVYQRTLPPAEQVFDLLFQLDESEAQSFLRSHKELANLFKVGASPVQQPLLLRVALDDYASEAIDRLEIAAHYAGGLGGDWQSPSQERLDLRFKTYMPFIAQSEGEPGAVVAHDASLPSISSLVQRDTFGTWITMDGGTIVPANMNDLLYGDDNKLYAGGNFTTIGTVTTKAVAYWFANDWNAMGTGGDGVSPQVYGFAKRADGQIVVVGEFDGMGGVANTKNIALYNPATNTFSSLASSFTGTRIQKAAFDFAGNLYVVGKFSNIGGIAMANVGYRTPGGTWTAMGGGLGTADVSTVLSLVVPPPAFIGGVSLQSVIAGGNFISPTTRIARWNGVSSWVAMGSASFDGNVQALARGPDGSIYAGGVDSIGVRKWNGVEWTTIGILTYPVTGSVQELTFSADGALYSGMALVTSISGLTLIDDLAAWDGSTWYLFADIDLPGVSNVPAIVESPDGTLTLAGNFGGTAEVTGATTVTNNGSEDAYPTFVITGPGTLWRLINNTTGEALYFKLTLLSGEIAVLNLNPGHIQFYSNFRPNLLPTILPGSDLGQWRLASGANVISAFITGDDSNTLITARWRENHLSLAGLAR